LPDSSENLIKGHQSGTTLMELKAIYIFVGGAF